MAFHGNDNDDAKCWIGKKKKMFPIPGASSYMVYTKYTNIDSKTTSFHILYSPTPLFLCTYCIVEENTHILSSFVRWKLHHRCLLCIISRSNKTTSACTFSFKGMLLLFYFWLCFYCDYAYILCVYVIISIVIL